jgi:hypothetical protein
MSDTTDAEKLIEKQVIANLHPGDAQKLTPVFLV